MMKRNVNSTLNIWQIIRTSRKKTILFILFVGIFIYLFLVFSLAILYYITDSIGSSNIIIARFMDAFYFSFVSFTTIGYGDISPINDLGKYILFFETICSVLFNGVFPSMLIIFSLKRPNSIILTSSLVITKNKEGAHILNMDIANRGGTLLNCVVTLSLFTFTKDGYRLKSYFNKKTYPLIEQETINIYSINLEEGKNLKLLLKLQDVFKKMGSKLFLRVSLTGNDADTGDVIALIKYYTEKNIFYGYHFQIVGFWKDDNTSNPKWDNFNKIFPNLDYKINDFLNIKLNDSIESIKKDSK